MDTTRGRSATPWPACRTVGPITTQRVWVLNVTPTSCRRVHLQLTLGTDRSITVIVPDMLRGLPLAEAACRTGAPVWVTAIVAGGRWVPVLFRQGRGARS